MDADSYKIIEADMEGKGVSVQSNPMELPEAEAKAVFDQLVKEVVVPKFNKIVDALGAIDLTSDAAKPVSSATQAALDLKVDKEKKTGSTTENKVLSDNNYSDGEQQKVAAADLARHTHGNKTILDGITEKDLTDWRGGNVLTKDNAIPYEPTGQYNPATVGYVNKTVVNIGAADMTKAVYDPNGKGQDIFAYADAVALDAKVMTDDSTGEEYVMGMNDGALYCAGVEEGAGQINVARQDTLESIGKMSQGILTELPIGDMSPDMRIYYDTPLAVNGVFSSALIFILADGVHFLGGVMSNSPSGFGHCVFKGSGEFVKLDDLPIFVDINTPASVNGEEIHIFGAGNSTYNKKHHVFRNRQWVALAELPFYAKGISVSNFVGNAAYIVGSSNSTQNQQCYIYDAITDSFKKLNDFPVSTYGSTVCLFNNYVLVIIRGFKTCYYTALSTISWSEISPSPVYGGITYSYCDGTKVWNTSSESYTYSPSTGTWTTITKVINSSGVFFTRDGQIFFSSNSFGKKLYFAKIYLLKNIKLFTDLKVSLGGFQDYDATDGIKILRNGWVYLLSNTLVTFPLTGNHYLALTSGGDET